MVVQIDEIPGDVVFKLRKFDGDQWGYEAFDLARDRSETTSIFDSAVPRHEEMARALKRYRDRLVERHAHFERERSGDAIMPPEEQLEALRSLGYVE